MLSGKNQMKLRRVGSATWSGDLREGKGTVSARSRALSNYPYGFESRIDGVRGTNPEELLAVAHASCFTMGLVMMLERIGKVALQVETQAEVALEDSADGYVIRTVHLKTRAIVPDLDEGAFADAATQARIHCPVSRLFRAEITLDAKLSEAQSMSVLEKRT
jgi:osmotically inducible protein OsmC